MARLELTERLKKGVDRGLLSHAEAWRELSGQLTRASQEGLAMEALQWVLAEEEAETDTREQQKFRDLSLELEDINRKNAGLFLLDGAERRRFWLNCNNSDANMIRV